VFDFSFVWKGATNELMSKNIPQWRKLRSSAPEWRRICDSGATRSPLADESECGCGAVG
jgi:hypothetical protein